MYPEVKSHSLNQKFKKFVYIGSIDPSISIEQIETYLLSHKLKVTFPSKKKFSRSKNYIKVKVTDEQTFNFLTKDKTEHKIGGFVVTTEEFLTGEQKLEKDIKEARKKIYVGNLPPSATNESLKNFFNTFGKVKTAYINNGVKRPEGAFNFGFVTFEEEETALKMIELGFLFLDENKLLLKEFRVKWGKNKGGNKKMKNGSRGNLDNGNNDANIRVNMPKAKVPKSLVKPRKGQYSERKCAAKRRSRDWPSFDCQSSSYDQLELLQYISRNHVSDPSNLRLNRNTSKNRRFSATVNWPSRQIYVPNQWY